MLREKTMETLKTKTQLLKEIETLKAQLEDEQANRVLANTMYEKELRAHKLTCKKVDELYATGNSYKEDLFKTLDKYIAENKELKEKLAAYENIDSFIKFIKSALKDNNARQVYLEVDYGNNAQLNNRISLYINYHCYYQRLIYMKTLTVIWYITELLAAIAINVGIIVGIVHLVKFIIKQKIKISKTILYNILRRIKLMNLLIVILLNMILWELIDLNRKKQKSLKNNQLK